MAYFFCLFLYYVGGIYGNKKGPTGNVDPNFAKISFHLETQNSNGILHPLP